MKENVFPDPRQGRASRLQKEIMEKLLLSVVVSTHQPTNLNVFIQTTEKDTNTCFLGGDFMNIEGYAPRLITHG